MICPNGNVTIDSLIKMVNSKEYVVYFEPFDEPVDWDWKKNGFYRSPNRTEIKTKNDLLKYIEKEYDKEGRIIYDITEKYYQTHPYVGESRSYIRETFEWEYSSPYGKKCSYHITECKYIGEPPEHIPLELLCCENGLNESCITIGYWDRDDEGYEFKSCGSRLFSYVCDEDLPEVWKAIKEADKYLNTRFQTEDHI